MWRAAIALVAIPAATSASASSPPSSNSGTAVTRSVASIAPASASAAAKKVFKQPTRKYLKKTCVIDLSALSDFTPVGTLTGCGQTITVTPTAEKRSVPGSWATWGSPPDTESATPHILYTVGSTMLTFDLSTPVKIFGVEAEPNPFEIHDVGEWCYNPDGSPQSHTVRAMSGDAGAKLLAMKLRTSRITS